MLNVVVPAKKRKCIVDEHESFIIYGFLQLQEIVLFALISYFDNILWNILFFFLL